MSSSAILLFGVFMYLVGVSHAKHEIMIANHTLPPLLRRVLFCGWSRFTLRNIVFQIHVVAATIICVTMTLLPGGIPSNRVTGWYAGLVLLPFFLIQACVHAIQIHVLAEKRGLAMAMTVDDNGLNFIANLKRDKQQIEYDGLTGHITLVPAIGDEVGYGCDATSDHYPSDIKVSLPAEQALNLLRYDVMKRTGEFIIRKDFCVGFTQNQLNALVARSFDLGSMRSIDGLSVALERGTPYDRDEFEVLIHDHYHAAIESNPSQTGNPRGRIERANKILATSENSVAQICCEFCRNSKPKNVGVAALRRGFLAKKCGKRRGKGA